MNIINKFKIILFILPLLLAFLFSRIVDAIPNTSLITKAINALFNIIDEKDLDELLRLNGFSKTSVKTYQKMRIIVTTLLMLVLSIGTSFNLISIFKGLLILIAAYKFFYIYLKMVDASRIKRLNILLPYAIKNISYLVYVFPVNNAIQKSIEIVPKEFKGDMELLLQEIDNDPITFKPYQNFIDRYKGKLNELESYLKVLYRLSDSGASESDKLITNLNIALADGINESRKEKNDRINSSISYLGMIPVILMTLMLTFLLLMIVTTINIG